jgi:hypothetical protein
MTHNRALKADSAANGALNLDMEASCGRKCGLAASAGTAA